MATHTQLKGVDNISDVLLSKTLELNCVSFFNWALLGVGGFFNVNIPTSGTYGGQQHRLRRVKEDPYFADGRVWEGFRADWVWESGVECPHQPIQISGVYVNGNFYPASTTGTYAHHINYPLGRVVFDTPISTSSIVTCEFSYRYVHFTHGGVPWWRQVQTNSMRVDSAHFHQQGSGAWSVLGQNRIQLPAVVVEAAPRTSRRPFEIGNNTAIVRQDVLFHVLAETPDDSKFLHDVITYQWDKHFFAFDPNRMFTKDKFPLTANGSVASGALMYPDLVAPTGNGGFRWNQVRIVNMQSVEFNNPASMWTASVRATFEVDLP